eukprot:3231303-Rhodomonas_salina.1
MQFKLHVTLLVTQPLKGEVTKPLISSCACQHGDSTEGVPPLFLVSSSLPDCELLPLSPSPPSRQTDRSKLSYCNVLCACEVGARRGAGLGVRVQGFSPWHCYFGHRVRTLPPSLSLMAADGLIMRATCEGRRPHTTSQKIETRIHAMCNGGDELRARKKLRKHAADGSTVIMNGGNFGEATAVDSTIASDRLEGQCSSVFAA